MPLSVSIIIPAHNAAATLDETLSSVVAQSHPHWEAIVVENGSTDQTAAAADAWSAREPRIRVAASAPGVGLARNRGLELARHPWILFLDADDWILPAHLETLTRQLETHPGLDAAHCGWTRVGPGGVTLSHGHGPADADLFPRFARTCVLIMHCCLIRRSLIAEVGGFDPALRTCEDWDLWQRLARAGCRFGGVDDVLACYRVRPGSASMNAGQLVADCRQVIARGFSADPRVRSPRPEHARGATGGDIDETLLYTVAWAAGLALGAGTDPGALLDLVPTRPGVGLDPAGVADCIHDCAMLPAALPASAWLDHFERIDPHLCSFVGQLESRTRQRGLTHGVRTQLLRRTVADTARPRPFTVGRWHAVAVEVTEPLPDFHLAGEVERLHAIVLAEGDRLGTLELPVVDGRVPADVLADAIAAEFAWPILGRFFGRTVYPTLLTARSADGWSMLREGQPLARQIAGNGAISWADAHDRIGWTVFLQEIWGEPQLAADDFYRESPVAAVAAADSAPVTGAWLVCEVSAPLPPGWIAKTQTIAVLTVGGLAVAQAPLKIASGQISAAAVRAALTTEAAFELCCACVREAVLGRPFREGTSLRARLAAGADARRAAAGSAGCRIDRRLGPGAAGALAQSVAQEPATLVVSRRPGFCGSSASRRALLPAALADEVLQVCARAHQPVVRTDATRPIEHVVCLPELIWTPGNAARATSIATTAAPAEPGDGQHGREFFESLFRSTPNPWLYTTAYEQKKYEQTLSLLPPRRFRRALELACAEGHFTVQLAPLVDALLATDFSPTALARAAARCEGKGRVGFAELDLVRDPLPGRFDLIVCSEVLYYAGSHERLQAVVSRIARALEPDGWFITAHAHLVADEPDRPGFDWDLPFGARGISDALQREPRLRLVKELRTPLYRVQLYRRQPAWRRWWPAQPPERTLLPQPTGLPPHVAAHARWEGGRPQRFQPPEDAETSELPILMYHRIAPDGAPAQRRYRLTPQEFEAQLALLVRRGYRGVRLDEWRRAMQARRPLAGRCVALTFDDGYRDFLTQAWPLLQKYGFVATVFLPTGHVGGTSAWDAELGATLPLMDWSDLRRLRAEGIEFGSHTVNHPPLTSLAPAEIAREGLRSLLTLQEQLGGPVSSFAYPYGETDSVVRAMIGACGYTLAVTCREARSQFQDAFLDLPRLEVRGDRDLTDFERLLSG